MNNLIKWKLAGNSQVMREIGKGRFEHISAGDFYKAEDVKSLVERNDRLEKAVTDLLVANGDPSTPEVRMDEVFDELEILIYGSLEAAHEANEKRLIDTEALHDKEKV